MKSENNIYSFSFISLISYIHFFNTSSFHVNHVMSHVFFIYLNIINLLFALCILRAVPIDLLVGYSSLLDITFISDFFPLVKLHSHQFLLYNLDMIGSSIVVLQSSFSLTYMGDLLKLLRLPMSLEIIMNLSHLPDL